MYVVYATAAGDRRIHVMTLDHASGKLAPLQVVELPGPDSPKQISMPLALSPDHRHLYAAIRQPPFPGSAFDIDQKTGRLSYAGSTDLTDGMCHLSVDPNGGFMLAASFTGSSLTTVPIGADARLGKPTQYLKSSGAHCVIFSEDGRFVYVASHGTDAILQFTLDRQKGELVASDPAGLSLAEGAGPRHIIVHTPTQRMYAVNEKNGTVDMLAIDPQLGNLSRLTTETMLPADYDAISSASDIHITRDGRFLYASERTKSFIASYAVDAEGGKLTPIERVDTEECPRGFTIDPSDRFLLCAGELSGGMSVYAIDQTTGRLTWKDRAETGPVTTWIEVIELP